MTEQHGGGIQRAVGSSNVQIQNVGAHAQLAITVDARPPQRLPLERAVIAVGEHVRSPTRLVRARSGVIPYTARLSLLREIEHWCRTSEAFAVRVIAGGAGTGKTRLAAQVSTDMANQGWLAGMYVPVDAGDEVDALAQAPTPRFLAIDYAETRPEQLAVLLPRLAADATSDYPVRVLLLVRTAPPSRPGDYLAMFDGHGDALAAIGDMAQLDLLSDAPLTEEERRDLFTEAASSLATHLGTEHFRTSAGDNGKVDLGADVFANPLLVVIAAYLASMSDEIVPSSRIELLDALIAHEERYWRQTSDARQLVTDEELRRRVVALTTMAGPADEEEAADLLRLVPDLADATEERRRNLARWADWLYGGENQWRAVEPDLVGEHLVATTWDAHPEVIAGVLTRRDPASVVQPLDIVRRAAIDHPGLFMTAQSVLRGRLAALYAQAIDQAGSLTNDLDILLSDATLAGALARAVDFFPLDATSLLSALNLFIPDPNLVLGPLALALTEHYIAEVRRLVETNPAAHLPSLAPALTNRSILLGSLGRQDEGLAAAEEAVTIYRELATTTPGTFLPSLSSALNNLSVLLGSLGRREEGLAAAEESVTIQRLLVAANAAAHLPNLASSLTNLSVWLGELGRRDEGLVAVEEAVTIYRKLATSNPDAYRPKLAAALTNLSDLLGNRGRLAEGLAASREAVTIEREIAATNAAAHLPSLASSLNSLSVGLAAIGQVTEGLAAATEGVTVYRKLADTTPAAFRPQLASSLHNQSIRFGELGRHEDALAAAEEAVAIHRELAETTPAAHLPNLASSLNNVSDHLRELGRRDEGLAAAEEAVSIQRRLAETTPAAHLPDLAGSLNNLSFRLAELDRPDDGLAAIREAVSIYRGLADTTPAAYLPALAGSLSNLSIMLGWLGEGAEGLAAVGEAVTIYRRLVDLNPSAFLPGLASSLHNLANSLRAVGRTTEAETAASEATSIST